jgi:predicted nuclease with TOPRIM domain
MSTNRYLCTVLEELRKAAKRLGWVTLPTGKRHISSLVEEVQTLANRMEAGLKDKKDFYRYTQDAGELGMSLKEYVNYLKERKEELIVEKAELRHLNRILEKQIENRKFKLARLKCDVCQVWEYCPEHPNPNYGLESLFG